MSLEVLRHYSVLCHVAKEGKHKHTMFFLSSQSAPPAGHLQMWLLDPVIFWDWLFTIISTEGRRKAGAVPGPASSHWLQAASAAPLP